MKRNVISLLLIVALLLALCAGLAEGTAVKRFIDLSGRWVDPNHDRALLKIMRAVEMDVPEDERDLVPEDLMALGYGQEMARRIVSLLEQTVSVISSTISSSISLCVGLFSASIS